MFAVGLEYGAKLVRVHHLDHAVHVKVIPTYKGVFRGGGLEKVSIDA